MTRVVEVVVLHPQAAVRRQLPGTAAATYLLSMKIVFKATAHCCDRRCTIQERPRSEIFLAALPTPVCPLPATTTGSWKQMLKLPGRTWRESEMQHSCAG